MVVMVSWYEADTFTCWLTSQFLWDSVLAKDHVIRLPSEAEWETVARGGFHRPERALVAAIGTSKKKQNFKQKNELPGRI